MPTRRNSLVPLLAHRRFGIGDFAADTLYQLSGTSLRIPGNDSHIRPRKQRTHTYGLLAASSAFEAEHAILQAGIVGQGCKICLGGLLKNIPYIRKRGDGRFIWVASFTEIIGAS